MKNYKKIIGILLASVLAFGAIGCGSSSEKEENAGNGAVSSSEKEDVENIESNSELQPVKIGVMGDTGVLQDSAIIAQKEGFFEEELAKAGYVPEYIGFAGAGPALNEAFVSKGIDIAVYSEFPAINARSVGTDIKIFASSNSQLGYAISISPDAEITSVNDLVGKTVVVPIGTSVYKYFAQLLQDRGLSIDDVEIVNSATDGPSMLASGNADAFITSETLIRTYESQGIGTILEDSISNYDQSSAFIFAGRNEYLSENPDAAVAIIKALQRAYEFAQNNPDDAISDMVKDGITLEIQEKVYVDRSFSYFNPQIDDELKNKIQDVASFMYENQLISNEINVDDLVDTSYYERAIEVK